MGRIWIPVDTVKDGVAEFVTFPIASGVNMRYCRERKWLEIDASVTNITCTAYKYQLGTIPAELPIPDKTRTLFNAGWFRDVNSKTYACYIQTTADRKLWALSDEAYLNGTSSWDSSGKVSLRVHWDGYWWYK